MCESTKFAAADIADDAAWTVCSVIEGMVNPSVRCAPVLPPLDY